MATETVAIREQIRAFDAWWDALSLDKRAEILGGQEELLRLDAAELTAHPHYNRAMFAPLAKTFELMDKLIAAQLTAARTEE